jgi:hypothetical protein
MSLSDLTDLTKEVQSAPEIEMLAEIDIKNHNWINEVVPRMFEGKLISYAVNNEVVVPLTPSTLQLEQVQAWLSAQV